MLLLFSFVTSCNVLPFAAVSISPIYGWVDGCNTVLISGHGFGDDVAATIGDIDVTDIALPEDPLDVGYNFTATVPAGAYGYADVTVTTGGESDTVTGSGAYYYVNCPQSGYVEVVEPSTGLAEGTAIIVSGCGLDPAAVRGRIVDADGNAVTDPFDFTSVCGTAIVSFAAPDMEDGTYYLEIVDSAGEVLNGTPCGGGGDTGTTDTGPKDTAPKDTAPKDTSPEDTSPEDTAPEDTSPEDSSSGDSGDTADTGAPACVDFPLTYGSEG